MIRRFFKLREVRKFVRNRLAVASLAFIGLYMFVALAVMFGVITKDDYNKRVLPQLSYGWLQTPDLEKRFDEADWFITKHIGPVFDRVGSDEESFRRGMDEIALFERKVADLPSDELREVHAELRTTFDRIDDVYLDYQDIGDELGFLKRRVRELEGSGEDPAKLEQYRAELVELQPLYDEARTAIEDGVNEIEADLNVLLPKPEGWDGFVYGFRTFLGSDALGRSISCRAFFSTKIAFQIGLVTAIVSVLFGTLLGASAGFFGGWVDQAVMWLVSVLSSVPYLVLLAVLIYTFSGSDWFDNPAERPGLALVPVYAAFCITFWIATCRYVRGEVMKIKELEYVQAATAVGFSKPYILLRHIIPNTMHLMLINFSLLFIGAIKAEVILSFLGLGVKGQPSWGVMIANAKDDVVRFFFWEVLSATVLMFGLVLAFNIVSDALQDAFDPKHVD